MTEKLPKGDRLIVQEKLDGTNVGVVRRGDDILAITRAGWLASTSPREMHHLFDAWVKDNRDRFMDVLLDGERLCGEWLAQAHGLKYELPHEPLVVFDMFTRVDYEGEEEVVLTFDELRRRNQGVFKLPWVFHDAPEACPLDQLPAVLSRHGAEGGLPEGFVYRWERKGRLLMRAKWVRPEKIDGLYLEPGKEVWNWRP